MSKKKKSKMKKTQVEQILDKNKITYEQADFPPTKMVTSAR